MSTFKRFEEDDIVRANPSEVTTGIWTGDVGILSAFYSSSTQAAAQSGQYYWNVYDANPDISSSAEVQFAVAYGHRTGGGNESLSVSNTATLSTQATYAQYRNMLLDPEDEQFTFDGSYSTDHIYVINIARARMKERLDPGNWAITLSGSNGVRTFIDDSGQTLGMQYGRTGRVFNVVSGSLSGVSGSTVHSSGSATFGGFGLVYPELGVIVLNPDAIEDVVGLTAGTFPSAAPFAPTTGSDDKYYNHVGLYNAIRLGGNFTARSSEVVSSTHYFVRLRNKEFNYSNNPTFYDEDNGALTITDFINNPRTYPTTIGLYNDANELCAVAKLSQPVQKSFDKELLVRVRLDW